jgi:hypothetical protein
MLPDIVENTPNYIFAEFLQKVLEKSAKIPKHFCER